MKTIKSFYHLKLYFYFEVRKTHKNFLKGCCFLYFQVYFLNQTFFHQQFELILGIEFISTTEFFKYSIVEFNLSLFFIKIIRPPKSWFIGLKFLILTYPKVLLEIYPVV